MTISNRSSMTTLTAAIALTLSGCVTTGDTQGQAMGAGIGAALGCGVGALVTGDAQGCATGAAIGGVLGWGVVAINQYQARQVRSSSADNRVYGLTKPVSSTQVKIRRGSNSPKSVRAGQPVNIVTDYSVMLPSSAGTAMVTESWTLKKDGKVVTQLPEKSTSRSAGGWEAQAEITIPADVPPGTYVIEHSVKSGGSYDMDESSFVIRS